MKIKVYLSARVTDMQVVPDRLAHDRDILIPRRIPPSDFEAAYIQVENVDGNLSLRLFDDKLDMAGIHGYALGAWVYFEIDGPPAPAVQKLIEERNANADRNTGMHL